MNCENTLGVMYLLVFILSIILVGMTIKEGTSDKKMVSWTLYSFSIIFGLVSLALIFFYKCKTGKSNNAKRITIPVLTVILCLSNMIGMIIAKPDIQTSQLFTPHLVNILLLIGSIFIGFGICGNSSKSSNNTKNEDSGEG